MPGSFLHISFIAKIGKFTDTEWHDQDLTVQNIVENTEKGVEKT